MGLESGGNGAEYEWGGIGRRYGWYGVFHAAIRNADQFHKFDESDYAALARVAAEAMKAEQERACDSIYYPAPELSPVACRLHRGHDGPHRAPSVEGADSGRPQTLGERHQAHYQSCNCLADSAVCCDPACPCKQSHPGRIESH